MTNFEKWKKDLTPDQLLYEGCHAGNKYKASIFICSLCPAYSCPRKNPQFISLDAICESSFLEWANKEES